MKWPSRLLRTLLAVIVVLVTLALLGLTYQAFGAARARAAYPPPGRLVDVGGYRMHIHCVGEGSPTVVLVAMAAGTSPMWTWVQDGLDDGIRVCAYDRAGWGWSDDGPDPRDARQTVDELQALLANAGEEGPFVLVGHSLGGLYVRLYAARYPDEVAGLVLVDASHPDQSTRLPPEQVAGTASFEQLLPTFSVLSRVGVFRLYFALGGELDMADLPDGHRERVQAFWSLPRHWDNQRREAVFRSAVDAQVLEASTSAGTLPVAIVTAPEGSSPEWLELQQDLTTLSGDSLQRTVSGASHVSLLFHPGHAQETADAIRTVVDAIRAGMPLAEWAATR